MVQLTPACRVPVYVLALRMSSHPQQTQELTLVTVIAYFTAHPLHHFRHLRRHHQLRIHHTLLPCGKFFAPSLCSFFAIDPALLCT